MNPSLYDELAFTWKKKIAEKVFQHNIPEDLILNFDQTPLGFTCPAKTTFTDRNSEIVPIGNLNDKRQITGTSVVNLSGEFLPIQLIYTGTTDLCHPKVNHWANEEEIISLLNKIDCSEETRKLESGQRFKGFAHFFYLFRGQTTAEVNSLLEKRIVLLNMFPTILQTFFNHWIYQ